MWQASKLSEMGQADKDQEPFITLSFQSEREHVHNYVCVCIDIFQQKTSTWIKIISLNWWKISKSNSTNSQGEYIPHFTHIMYFTNLAYFHNRKI